MAIHTDKPMPATVRVHGDRDDQGDLADVTLEYLLDVHDAARMLNVSVSWVYEHVRPDAQDRLPVVKLGKYLRFDARDLRAYVDAKRTESTPARARR
jgi:predicted DNA-binding transcriptional regulator AlpA